MPLLSKKSTDSNILIKNQAPNRIHPQAALKRKLLLLVLILYGCLLSVGVDIPFFWDSIQLGAKHAYHYFDQDMMLGYLPDSINSGHIPVFGYYLAACWSLFGKSLVVSHLSMWPFVFATILCLWKILALRISDPYYLFLGVVICIMDPTLLTQMLMVSPDVVLICGFVLVLYGYKIDHRWLLILGFLLLASISIRGIVLAGIITLWMILQGKSIKSLFIMGLPAILIVLTYYMSHYVSQGWIGVHSDSPWQSSISLADPTSIIKNAIVMLWRLLDFGRIVWIWVILSVFMLGSGTKVASTRLVSLLPYLLIGFALLTIPFVGLTGHRYYLPIILLGLMSGLVYIYESRLSHRYKVLLFALILVSQLASHRIVYPETISQGWDSSLAFLPYLSHVEELEDYLQRQEISCSEVGTYFPLRGNSKYRDLVEQDCIYPSAEVGKHQYLISSNVMNDLKSEERLLIGEQYQIIRSWHKRGVYLYLHKLE